MKLLESISYHLGKCTNSLNSIKRFDDFNEVKLNFFNRPTYRGKKKKTIFIKPEA